MRCAGKAHNFRETRVRPSLNEKTSKVIHRVRVTIIFPLKPFPSAVAAGLCLHAFASSCTNVNRISCRRRCHRACLVRVGHLQPTLTRASPNRTAAANRRCELSVILCIKFNIFS